MLAFILHRNEHTKRASAHHNGTSQKLSGTETRTPASGRSAPFRVRGQSRRRLARQQGTSRRCTFHHTATTLTRAAWIRRTRTADTSSLGCTRAPRCLHCRQPPHQQHHKSRNSTRMASLCRKPTWMAPLCRTCRRCRSPLRMGRESGEPASRSRDRDGCLPK